MDREADLVPTYMGGDQSRAGFYTLPVHIETRAPTEDCMARNSASRFVATLGTAAALSLAPETVAAQTHYIGEIKWVAFDITPTGWADCDGQILSIAQNTALFALLGTTYGGNGKSTFALPDMRSRFVIDDGEAPGLPGYVPGQVGGEETHSLTVDELPAHSHGVSDHAHAMSPLAVDLKASSGPATDAAAAGRIVAKASTAVGGGAKVTAVYGSGPADVTLGSSAGVTLAGTTGASTATAWAVGNSTAHSIMPPFTTLKCIIATTGAFPPRQ
jgi:microcystin-dependent protein